MSDTKTFTITIDAPQNKNEHFTATITHPDGRRQTIQEYHPIDLLNSIRDSIEIEMRVVGIIR